MKPVALESDYWEHTLTYMPKNAFVQQLDSVAGVKKNSLVGLKTSGIAGDPVPYLFRTDSFVTIVLMVSFFLVVWVISRSRHYLRHQVKDFFHHRQRENLFAERTQTEMRGQLFLIFQTCFVLGILFFDYTQVMASRTPLRRSPERLRKKLTVIGMMGHTQGVNKATRPPTKPRKNM